MERGLILRLVLHSDCWVLYDAYLPPYPAKPVILFRS